MKDDSPTKSLNQTASVINMLEKGQIDQKSQSTVEIVSKIVGDTHAESRSFVNDLRFQLAKEEISVTEEQALALARRPHHVPLLEKKNYLVDKMIDREAKINPLLVKNSEIGLPKVIQDKIELHKLEETLKKRKSLSPLTRAAVSRATSS